MVCVDELIHAAGLLSTVVEGTGVVDGVMCASPLQNSFVETRRAMLHVFVYVFCFVMSMKRCRVVMFCSGKGVVGVTCAVLSVEWERCRCGCCCCCCSCEFFGCHVACDKRNDERVLVEHCTWITCEGETSSGKGCLLLVHPRPIAPVGP